MTKCPYRANHECTKEFNSFGDHVEFCKMCLQGMIADEIGLNTSAIMGMSMEDLEKEAIKRVSLKGIR